MRRLAFLLGIALVLVSTARPEDDPPAPAASPARETAADRDELEAYPREVALDPGETVEVDLWRASLELERSRSGGELRLEVERARTEDIACQRLTVERTRRGVRIASAAAGGEICTERLQVRLSVPHGVRLTATLSDGDIAVGAVDGDLRLATLAGRVQIEGASGSLRVETAAGDIRVRDCAAGADLRSASGRIFVAGDLTHPLRARSVTGGIDVRLGRLRPVSLEAQTLSGDVTVRIPRESRAALDLDAGEGTLDAEFTPPGATDGGEDLPVLRLRTRRGALRLRALAPGDQEPEEETASEKS